jgi:hypothetical protein
MRIIPSKRRFSTISRVKKIILLVSIRAIDGL